MEKQGEPQKIAYKFEPRKGWEEKGNGKRRYEGPVYTIKYPAWCDGFTELTQWDLLGYYVPPTSGFIGQETIITVYGYIPEDFQAALEDHGVTFEKKDGKLEISK